MIDLLGLLNLPELAESFNLLDVATCLILSFSLSSLIGLVYRFTHRGASYSPGYVHTLILMSMVVGIIMLIVGSNIARAFSLVGALSIIRFRNAMKETRDVGFIFFAMAIGMACGTRFYILAVASTLIISLAMTGMHRFKWLERKEIFYDLVVQFPFGEGIHETLKSKIHSFTDHASLRKISNARNGELLEAIYQIRLKPGMVLDELISELRIYNGNHKVVLLDSSFCDE